MNAKALYLLILTAFLGLLPLVPAEAQQHRATRLGNPAHRFAKPLQKPEDLRALFANPKLRADVESILNQAQWPGDVEDLRRAAATAEILAVRLPTGTQLPFMSSRNKGKPVALIDVLWVGKEPIAAYQFDFASRGRKYRCVTPKLCANFLVVDLGPLIAVELTKTGPTDASLCDPIEMSLTVRNIGGQALTQVQIVDPLPDNLKPVTGSSPLRFDVGTLPPNASRTFTFQVRATAAGQAVNQAHVTSAEGGKAEASCAIKIHAPVLELECKTPPDSRGAKPFDVCLNLTNKGDAAEPQATVVLPIPAGATFVSATQGGGVVDGRISWNLGALPTGESRSVCATLTSAAPGSLSFAPTASGTCASPTQSRCEAQVAGIPAILLEVIDLADPIEVGNPVTYEIRVTNQGSAPLTQIRMTGFLPESQEYVSGSGATTVQANGRTVTMEALGRLEAKADAVWRIVAKALKVDDARFKVELTSDQFQRPVEEFEATAQY
ncbi:MAG: DUF11 domain-containing protein [Verrucomicrobiales bacterium]|nr:DUF11 domain-containing protein [Verrucomicrobiales bacterium]